MVSRRCQRVGELLKEEIGGIIENELKDCSVGFVTLTNVKVSSDLRYAKVYFSVLGDESQRQAAIEGLRRAKSFIQAQLGRRIRLRYTPKISFIFDDSIEYGVHILELLKKKVKEGD